MIEKRALQEGISELKLKIKNEIEVFHKGQKPLKTQILNENAAFHEGLYSVVLKES